MVQNIEMTFCQQYLTSYTQKVNDSSRNQFKE